MKINLSAKTLYTFFVVKMLLWCIIVFGLQMEFVKMSASLEIRTIPAVQWVITLAGVAGILALYAKNYIYTLTVSVFLIMLWSYVGVGLGLKDVTNPNWVRIALDIIFIQYVVYYQIRHKKLD